MTSQNERQREEQQAAREFADPEYLAAFVGARREIEEGCGIPADEVVTQAGL